MRILAVIPARGGSKGIPRKNVRIMNGKPLIYYSINNAKLCDKITDIVVTSDDDELLAIAEKYGANTLKRSAELAQDHITLDPVIHDAVIKMEQLKGYSYDAVITLQPTSPALKPETLSRALSSFIDGEFDTFISAVNKPHLAWTKDINGEYRPLYKKRLNRQQLPPNYLEAGAFLITKREFVTQAGRLGKRISVYEIPEEESTDIDSISDWIVCESILAKKRVVLRADGYKKIGMGHIYHCLTLYYNLTGHEVMFVSRSKHKEGITKLKNSFVPLTEIESDNDFFVFLARYKPDIVVNDCLDTTEDYILKLKTLCPRVITIEDMGEGAKSADVVINALYENDPAKDSVNVYSGQKYVCLRDEFLIAEPKEFEPEVKNVLVIFGGTDPSNLTSKVYAMAQNMHKKYPKIEFTFLTGIGYDLDQNNITTSENENIYVLNDIKFVSTYMRQADLAITSQGRTVYELAVLGVPSIVLAQNEREQKHTFAQMKNGFLNLGLGCDVDIVTLEKTFEWFVGTPQIRQEMRQLMLNQELKSGVKREIRLILGE